MTHHSPAQPTALSRNNQLVLDRLAKADTPLSAYDLLDALRGEGLRAPPQIYRALNWLREAGLVHKLESANAYVACAHAACCGGARCGSDATVFLMCERCGHVDEMQGEKLAADLNALASLAGFAARTSSLEVQGLCAVCQANAA